MAASFCNYFFSFCVFTFFCVVEISYIKMSYTLFLISKIKAMFMQIFGGEIKHQIAMEKEAFI